MAKKRRKPAVECLLREGDHSNLLGQSGLERGARGSYPIFVDIATASNENIARQILGMLLINIHISCHA